MQPFFKFFLTFFLIGAWVALFGQTTEPAQMSGLGSFQSFPLHTIGETFNGYQPVGILDGLGAQDRDSVVRVFANHELGGSAGKFYFLSNGTPLRGGRVSYFDIDKSTRQIVEEGLAFNVVIDRAGLVVASGAQINEGVGGPTAGIDRLCASSLFEAGTFNLEDDIYFTGEEATAGQEFALDVNSDTLWCLPWLGRAGWENVTLLETGESNHVAILIGDDRTGAPLLLYVGEKNHFNNGSFLDRNGLAWGTLSVLKMDNGNLNPATYFGTGATRTATFVQIPFYNPAMAGTANFDAQGFATQTYQDALGDVIGGFSFSRPEDLATNPANPTQVVLASTGQPTQSDLWGTTYLIDFDLSDLNNVTVNVKILYDGDDAGNGQFAHPDWGLRSPDNLDWADNGLIYIQEDRSVTGFGSTSLREASIWALNPATGILTRIGEIDRTAVPDGQTDSAPADRGNWESSGIVDVSSLFGVAPDSILFVADVQGHSLTGGPITADTLGEGGQLFLFKGFAPCELSLPDTFSFCSLAEATIERPTGMVGFLTHSGSTVSSMSFTASGEYVLTAVAPNGCQATDTVEVIISTMSAAATKVSNTGSACAPNGSVNLTVQNGLAPLSFVWNNGATTEDLSSVAAGTYQVTIADAVGCTKTLPGLGVVVAGTKPISLLSTTFTQPNCFGGTAGSKIRAMFTGGKKPYSYAWSNGANTVDPTNFISNVAAGTYSVTLTDAQGCTFVQNELVLEQPEELLIEEIAIAPDPAKPGKYKASFTVSGGTPFPTGAAYRYTKSYPTAFGIYNPITNIAAGIYTMAVRDKKLCTATQSVTVGGNKSAAERGEQIAEKQLVINPNPVREVLNLKFETELASIEGELTIFDMAGRNWFEQTLNFAKGETLVLPVEEFPAGNYQAVFTTASGERFQKRFSIVR